MDAVVNPVLLKLKNFKITYSPTYTNCHQRDKRICV